ncbi:MAG: hypothetical protein OXE75_04000 [bacterium]|nr:hypothetical protein [bacterium]
MTTPEAPDRFPHGEALEPAMAPYRCRLRPQPHRVGVPDVGSAPIPVKLDPYRTLNEES